MIDPIYRGYDQSALDREYRLRERVPDFQRFFDHYEADSAAVRERLTFAADLAYGERPRQRIDLFPAVDPGSPGAPLFVFIHGGYWQAFAKEAFEYLVPPFVEAGAAWAAVSYTLAPEATIPEIVDEVRAALVWLWRHGAEHGADPRRLVVCGHSAGGHLAAMMAATDWTAHGAPADLVKATLPISGLYDLEPLRLSYQNAVLGLDADQVRVASPIHHRPTTRGPVVLAVGGEETDEFRRQQADFKAAWQAAGAAMAEVAMPGFHHFDVIDALADPASPLHRTARDLLGL
jgi:arylformamidase